MSAWIVYSKDGLTERCELHAVEYGGTHMGERAVTATFESDSKVDFDIFDYLSYRGEVFELESVPTVKKTSSFEYSYELRFVSRKYELERCEMRDLVPSDNGVVYPTPLSFSFTGDVRYLTDRIQACLDDLYGEGVWNIVIADGVESEEKNITIAQQNCWNALALVNSTYGLDFYIKGRVITIGGSQPVVSHVFEYGKGNGLYEIERAANTDTAIVTKLRAYGSDRNLDYSYPKKPEWSDSNLPVSFAFSPLRLMLPSFKVDKTDYVLADEETIKKYGIREASIVYEDIYPSITGATHNGQAIDEIKAVDVVDDNASTFVVYLHDLGFDLEEHLTTADAQISMKSGAMQGYTFTISNIEKQEDNSYKITLGRVSAEGGENYNIPNSDWNMREGDKFVLLNILMPQKYIREAENRLKQRAEEYLAQYSKTNFGYNIGLHDKFLIENPSVYDALIEGSKLSVYDEELGISEDVTIQSITITENAADNTLPQVKVTLNNEPSASTLDRIQGKIDSLANESAANNFATQSEIMAQYRKKLDKPFFDKLFAAVDAEGNEIPSTDTVTPVAYIKARYDFAVVGGVTMYLNDGSLDLPSIFEGIPVDNDTIYWDGEVLKSRGVGEGGVTPTLLGDLKNVGSWANGVATEDRIMVQKKDSSSWEALELSKIGGSASFENVKESGEGNAFTSFVPSEDKKTLTFVKGKNFAEKSETLSGYGIKDAYTKTEADSLLEKKWTQDNNKITNWDTSYGWGDHSKAGYASKSTTLAGYGITNAYTKTETDNLLNNKADWGITLEDYGITNAYTSEEVDELLGNYLPLSGGIITEDLRLRKGDEYTSPYLYFGDRDEVWLKEVNDTHLTIHADGTVIIDADLIVKGGITMYANDGDYTPSTIMDAVSVDNQTIIKQNGKLMVNPELVFGGGGSGEVSSIAWGNIIGKPSWITDTKPKYSYTEISGTPDLSVYATKGTTLAHYGIADAYTKTEVDNNFVVKTTKDFMKVNGNLTSNVDFNDYYTSGSYNNTTGDGSGNSNTPDTYGLMLVFGDKSGFAAQLHVNAGNTSVKIRTRYVHGGSFSWKSWKELAYTTSNVASATKLETARKIWGNSFDGSKDVSGNIDLMVSKIFWHGDANNYYISCPADTGGAGLVYKAYSSHRFVSGGAERLTILSSGYVGVNNSAPTTNFHVNGTSQFDGTVLARNVRPQSTDVYSLGTSAYQWNGLYSKKAYIDGIEIKKSANGVLYIGGNLVVSGGVTMYGTDGTTASTIWDNAPIANTNGKKGVASYDPNFFAVENGVVKFIGQTGGGVADSVAWGNVTGKPTWLGSSKPSYTTGEVSEGTNLYFTNARAVSALSSTLSNYLPLSGGTLTDELTGTTIIAHDLYWREYKNKTLSSGGWYRFATSTRPDSYGNTYILSICRVYNSTSNESYLIAVTLDYSGCSFTQLAGHRYSTASQLVTKIRCTRTHSGDVYFDFYYTGSSQNTVYVNAIGHCKVQTPEATSSTLTYTDEFSLEEGVKSSLGFIGDLKGNADTATSATTATTASKLSTVSKTAWGQTYWTSGGIPTNISGNMSSVGSITPSTHNTYSIGSYGNGFAWSNFNCISSGAVSNNLWLCGGTTSGIGVVIARSNSNTVTGELCRFTEQGMVWASGVIPAIVSTAQEIHLKYNNSDATSIVLNSTSFKPFISSTGKFMLGRYDSLWNGLYVGADASAANNMKGVNFCDTSGYGVGKVGSSSAGMGVYCVDTLYLRGGCTKGANGTMTVSTTGAVIDASGNMLVTGGVTMYSDLRKKTILNHVELSLKEVADAPLIEHYYNSDESKRTHVGSVAQYWAGLNDWFCKEDEEGFLTMEIQNAALASAISVARELTRYESKTDKQIKKLKKRIGELEEEIKNLKKM